MTPCVIAGIVAVVYVVGATWMVRRSHRTATEALTLAADSQEQAALAKAQLEQFRQARRSLPLVILAVAVGYAHKAKN